MVGVLVMLIRNATIWAPPVGSAGDECQTADVRITGGRIAGLSPALHRAAREEVIDAGGCALLPGLHDHHIHLRALAAVRASVNAGPPHVRTAADLAHQLKAANVAAQEGQWLRCTGYHESVAGLLDRYALDRLAPPNRPVRVQHRSGALWTVNSAAAALLGLDECDLPGVERDETGTPTGRLWRLDRWLADRVPSVPPDLRAVSAQAAAWGITGFTDATPDMMRGDITSLAEAVADGRITQRLHCMAPADVSPPPHAMVTIGPVKIMLDDGTLPPLGELTDQVRRAHAVDRAVAVHCVTRVQLILALAALDDAGRLPGDRIEHGAIIPGETIPALRGLAVVTQPHFVTERGAQYAADVDPSDLPDLWRLRSLIAAGVGVAGGSDAPFGGADPWHVARSATRRPPLSRTNEAISPAAALSLFLGEPDAPATPRRIAPGRAADLILLRLPLHEALRSLTSDLVATTFIGGRAVG
jgi:predicted amidohydrolase YtcJ